MSGLFAGTPLERPVTCPTCEREVDACRCPRDAAGAVCLPRDQTARISTQRRRGKLVTCIQGLDAHATDLGALAGELRARCGAGGTVKDGVIEIQGDHRTTIAAILSERGYRVP